MYKPIHDWKLPPDPPLGVRAALAFLPVAWALTVLWFGALLPGLLWWHPSAFVQGLGAASGMVGLAVLLCGYHWLQTAAMRVIRDLTIRPQTVSRHWRPVVGDCDISIKPNLADAWGRMPGSVNFEWANCSGLEGQSHVLLPENRGLPYVFRYEKVTDPGTVSITFTSNPPFDFEVTPGALAVLGQLLRIQRRTR